MINPAYSVENARSRDRLQQITNQLSDEELNRKLSNGWTVAIVLLHLAFWDRYYLVLLEDWERSGYVHSAVNVEALNDTISFVGVSLPPRLAVELARSAAELVDHKLEEIPIELARTIEESGHPRILRRALHRNEHLGQIEDVRTVS